MSEPQNPGRSSDGRPDPSHDANHGGFEQPTAAFGPTGPTTGQQWQTPHPGPPPPSGPYPVAPGPGQFGPGGPMPGQPPFPPGYAPPRPSFAAMLPMPVKLALGSSLFGIVTFFMGFLGWLTIDSTIERDADEWASNVGNSLDVPAFFSPSLILSPGWFFILLGAIGVGTISLVATKWRRFLPYLAFGSVVGWLGLFACAMGLPVFVGFGPGAYIALIFGFIQAALLSVATLLDGLHEDKVGGQGPYPPA